METKDTLQIFLEALLSPVGAGVFLWGAVAFVIKAIPWLDAHTEGKFWLTWLLALLIPPGAFGLQIALGYATFTWDGLFTTAGVAYMVSQGVHRGTSAVRAKVAENAEKAKDEEHKRMVSERLAFVGNIPQGHTPFVLPAESIDGHIGASSGPTTGTYAAPIAPSAPVFVDGERSVDLSNSGDVTR